MCEREQKAAAKAARFGAHFTLRIRHHAAEFCASVPQSGDKELSAEKVDYQLSPAKM